MRSSLVFAAVSLVLLCVAVLPTVAPAQPLASKKQACVRVLNDGLRKVAVTQTSESYACIKRGAKGRLAGTIEACVAADAKGKVAKAESRTQKAYAKKCGDLPPFGPADPDAVNAAAVKGSLDLLRDLFGPDLDAAIIAQDVDRNSARCQQAVAAAVKKCRDRKLAEFNKCKKQGLKQGLITSAGALASCVGADPRRAIAKKCDDAAKPDALRKTLAKKCVAKGVDLAVAFPPCGVSGDVEATHTCLKPPIECRVCLAIDQADGLVRNCDAFDDGLTNASCDVPLPLPVQSVFLPLVSLASPVAGTEGGGPMASLVNFTSSFQVQNSGNTNALVSITYYWPNGTVAASGRVLVPANSPKRIFPGVNDGAPVPSPFLGSARLDSTNAIAAVVNQEASSPSFLGAAYSPASQGANSLRLTSTRCNLPSIRCNDNGFNSVFYLRNVSVSPASVAVSYLAAGAGANSTDTVTIPADGMAIFDQHTDATPGKGCETLGGMDARFTGSAVVSSDQPLVATVLNLSAGSLQSYTGCGEDALSLLLPNILANDGNRFTQIVIENAGSSAASLTVTYAPNAVSGGNEPVIDVAMLAPNESVIFTQRGISGSNDWSAVGPYVGGATVTGDQPLAAIVRQQDATDAAIGSLYNGLPSTAASMTLALPLVWADFGGFATAFTVQSTGNGASVTVTYSENTLQSGETPSPDITALGAGEVAVFRQAGNSGTNDWDVIGSYVGSVVITSNQPVHAVGQIAGPSGLGDTLFGYEGVAQ